MSIENFAELNSYDIARAEIETWRGECIDVLAQGETLIGALLGIAREAGLKVQLHPVSEQRTLEAARLVDAVGGSEADMQAGAAALTGWQALESRRSLLAHGVMTVALDRHGGWFAMFDTVSYRADQATRGRWAVSQGEAEDFRAELDQAYATLKRRLGQIRQGIGH